MPRIKSRKKNGRKEIKFHNLLNISAGAISQKPTSENQERNHKIVTIQIFLVPLMHSCYYYFLFMR